MGHEDDRPYSRGGLRHALDRGSLRLSFALADHARINRITIDLDADPLEEAREILGTKCHSQTVNEALRVVGRRERLPRGAVLVSFGKLGLVEPDELARQRQPRADWR